MVELMPNCDFIILHPANTCKDVLENVTYSPMLSQQALLHPRVYETRLTSLHKCTKILGPHHRVLVHIYFALNIDAETDL
jgi:hypothetical protein